VYSLARTLDAIAGHLGSRLVAPAALADLRSIADGLPAALSRCLYLERWLRGDASAVDLIVRVHEGARPVLAGECPPLQISDPLREHPSWRRIEAFARDWGRPPLDRGVDGVWLEFDRVLDARRTPRVFVDFARAAYTQASPDARLELLRRVAASFETDCADAQARQLRLCLERLPAQAHLLYVGLPLDGRNDLLRVCVLGLGPEDLVRYLVAVGWPGDSRDLVGRVLKPFERTGEGSPRKVGVLHFDVEGARVGPRIGIEYPFPQPARPEGIADDSLLVQLVDRGECAPEVLEDLRRWPGVSVEMMPHEIWHCRVSRRISHVKLVYAPAAPIEAKAYVCLAYRLLPMGTLVGMRPKLFRAGARLDGAPPRSAPAMPEARGRERPDPQAVRDIMAYGRRFALYERKGGQAMSPKEQQVLEAVLQRSTEDAGFRARLLTEPRAAIFEAFGVKIPEPFRVKFIEKGSEVDALVVLPEFRTDELSDQELENVAGGAGQSSASGAWLA
jgi:hypothetical protein